MKKVDKVVIFILVSMLCTTTSIIYYQLCEHFGYTGEQVIGIVAMNILCTIPFMIYPICILTVIVSLFDGTFVEHAFWVPLMLINHLIMYKLYCVSFKEEWKQFSKTRIWRGPDIYDKSKDPFNNGK